jgi:hypothetical protein
MRSWRWLGGIVRELRRLGQIEQRLERVQAALGRVEARQLKDVRSSAEAEFQVFSQWGEDGIIQWLVRHVPIEHQLFVEFGVQDYRESNTRFLLVNNGWAGLVMDGSAENVRRIREDGIYWRHNLKAQAEFVTRENINELLTGNGVQGSIGLLSIDIDGNDYWVWEAITVVEPAIVVVEYNARFGPRRAVTVPYRADFVRSRAHYSMIYYGASLTALWALGRRKGSALVGCNSAGNNAFFVRHDLLGALRPLTPEEAFRPNCFREARDQTGALAFLTPSEEEALLAGLPLVEVEDREHAA